MIANERMEKNCEWMEMIVNGWKWLWMNGNDCGWIEMIVNE